MQISVRKHWIDFVGIAVIVWLLVYFRGEIESFWDGFKIFIDARVGARHLLLKGFTWKQVVVIMFVVNFMSMWLMKTLVFEIGLSRVAFFRRFLKRREEAFRQWVERISRL